MSRNQFEAICQLLRMRGETTTKKALHDVFVLGNTQRQAYSRYGLNRQSFGRSVWKFRKVIALAVTAVVNEKVVAEAQREGGHFSPQDPLRGIREVINGDS